MQRRSFNILIFFTLLFFIITFILFIIKYINDVDEIKKLFISERMSQVNETKRNIEQRFTYFYQALRTMSMLPSIKNYEENGLKISPSDIETLQQIYNIQSILQNITSYLIFILITRLPS